MEKNFVESVDMTNIPNQKTNVIGQFGNGRRPVTQIELITPTQQAVEMARSELKKRNNDGEPIVHFEAPPEKKKPRRAAKKKRNSFVYTQ